MGLRNLSLFVLLTIATSGAYAADQQRQGFILGLGIGPSNVEIDSGNASESSSGFGTSFMVGGGITDQFTLYYLNDVSFFEMEVVDQYGDTVSDLFAAGLTSVGLSYYFSPQAPSTYIGVGVGLGSLVDMVDSTTQIGRAHV